MNQQLRSIIKKTALQLVAYKNIPPGGSPSVITPDGGDSRGAAMTLQIHLHTRPTSEKNFTALLTPVTDASRIPYTFGAPSSITITEGSFKNVPVFY